MKLCHDDTYSNIGSMYIFALHICIKDVFGVCECVCMCLCEYHLLSDASRKWWLKCHRSNF